jgi:hypothetical protein
VDRATAYPLAIDLEALDELTRLRCRRYPEHEKTVHGGPRRMPGTVQTCVYGLVTREATRRART